MFDADDDDDDLDDDEDDSTGSSSSMATLSSATTPRPTFDVFDVLGDLSRTGDVVELCYLDPDSGRERAVTGPLVDVDVRNGLVTVERQPDREMVTIDAVDLFDIRVLGAGGR